MTTQSGGTFFRYNILRDDDDVFFGDIAYPRFVSVFVSVYVNIPTLEFTPPLTDPGTFPAHIVFRRRDRPEFGGIWIYLRSSSLLPQSHLFEASRYLEDKFGVAPIASNRFASQTVVPNLSRVTIVLNEALELVEPLTPATAMFFSNLLWDADIPEIMFRGELDWDPTNIPTAVPMFALELNWNPPELSLEMFNQELPWDPGSPIRFQDNTLYMLEQDFDDTVTLYTVDPHSGEASRLRDLSYPFSVSSPVGAIAVHDGRLYTIGFRDGIYGTHPEFGDLVQVRTPSFSPAIDDLVSAAGELYAASFRDQMLYTVDTNTGALTLSTSLANPGAAMTGLYWITGLLVAVYQRSQPSPSNPGIRLTSYEHRVINIGDGLSAISFQITRFGPHSVSGPTLTAFGNNVLLELEIGTRLNHFRLVGNAYERIADPTIRGNSAARSITYNQPRPLAPPIDMFNEELPWTFPPLVEHSIEMFNEELEYTAPPMIDRNKLYAARHLGAASTVSVEIYSIDPITAATALYTSVRIPDIDTNAPGFFYPPAMTMDEDGFIFAYAPSTGSVRLRLIRFPLDAPSGSSNFTTIANITTISPSARSFDYFPTAVTKYNDEYYVVFNNHRLYKVDESRLRLVEQGIFVSVEDLTHTQDSVYGLVGPNTSGATSISTLTDSMPFRISGASLSNIYYNLGISTYNAQIFVLMSGPQEVELFTLDPFTYTPSRTVTLTRVGSHDQFGLSLYDLTSLREGTLIESRSFPMFQEELPWMAPEDAIVMFEEELAYAVPGQETMFNEELPWMAPEQSLVMFEEELAFTGLTSVMFSEELPWDPPEQSLIMFEEELGYIIDCQPPRNVTLVYSDIRNDYCGYWSMFDDPNRTGIQWQLIFTEGLLGVVDRNNQHASLVSMAHDATGAVSSLPLSEVTVGAYLRVRALCGPNAVSEWVESDPVTVFLRIPDGDTSLASLTVNDRSITIEPGRTSYTDTRAPNTEQIVIAVEPNNPLAVVEGDLSTRSLDYGENVFTFTVTAPNGNVQEYTLTSTRRPPPLLNLRLGVGFFRGTRRIEWDPLPADGMFTVEVSEQVYSIRDRTLAPREPVFGPRNTRNPDTGETLPLNQHASRNRPRFNAWEIWFRVRPVAPDGTAGSATRPLRWRAQ